MSARRQRTSPSPSWSCKRAPGGSFRQSRTHKPHRPVPPPRRAASQARPAGVPLFATCDRFARTPQLPRPHAGGDPTLPLAAAGLWGGPAVLGHPRAVEPPAARHGRRRQPTRPFRLFYPLAQNRDTLKSLFCRCSRLRARPGQVSRVCPVVRSGSRPSDGRPRL